MYHVDDAVVVLDNKEMVGIARIVDICKTQADVHKYFGNFHPLFKKFVMAVTNAQEVYIVNFHGDLGQGGYIRQSLRPSKQKRKVTD